MNRQPFTLAMYRVRPGSEDAFIDTWRDLANVFTSLPAPPIWGTLIRSTSDPALFYSFGPWNDGADVLAMRSAPAAQKAFERLGALCAEITPGNYEVVEHIVVQRE